MVHVSQGFNVATCLRRLLPLGILAKVERSDLGFYGTKKKQANSKLSTKNKTWTCSNQRISNCFNKKNNDRNTKRNIKRQSKNSPSTSICKNMFATTDTRFTYPRDSREPPLFVASRSMKSFWWLPQTRRSRSQEIPPTVVSCDRVDQVLMLGG